MISGNSKIYLNQKLISIYLHKKPYNYLNKGKKIEKSNTALIYYYEKKMIQKFLDLEKKIIFLHKFSLKKKNFNIWDDEKQLIGTYTRCECSGLFLGKKSYIHIEEFLSLKETFKQIFMFKKGLSSVFEWILKSIKTYLPIQQILLFISLRRLNIIVNRFYLRIKFTINPDYICWSDCKDFKTIFNVLLHKRNSDFNSHYNISSLLARIRPGILKLAYFGISSFVFFSIESGFSMNSPFFLKKKYKKKFFLFN
jgi:hypothetical protein